MVLLPPYQSFALIPPLQYVQASFRMSCAGKALDSVLLLLLVVVRCLGAVPFSLSDRGF